MKTAIQNMIDWLKSRESVCIKNGEQPEADILNGHILVALSFAEKESQNIKDDVIKIFVSAKYRFLKEEPSGRLLFYSPMDGRDIQFWYNEENCIERAVELITSLSFARGEKYGRNAVRNEIKSALEIN